MRIERNVFLASTRIDAHGEQRSHEELLTYYNQIPDSHILNQSHDYSKPPIGKIINKHFITLDDGNYEIAVDVEIWDEDVWDDMGGLSISYTPERLSANPNSNSEIELLFNSMIFDKDEILSIWEEPDVNLHVDIVELKQKALENVPVIILTFIGSSILSTIIGAAATKMGKSLLSRIEQILSKSKAKYSQETYLQLHFDIEISGEIIPVHLNIESSDIGATQAYSIETEEVIKYAKKILEGSKVQRLTLKISDQPPHILIDHFVDLDGKTISV